MQGFVLSIALAGGQTAPAREPLLQAFAPLRDFAGHRVLEVGEAPDSVDACLVLEASDILDDHLGTAADDQQFVVCYGEVDDRAGSPAARLLAAYRDHGMAGLGTLAGCFGAVIVDRASGNTLLVGDGLGQRNLRYGRLDGRLLIATHDIFLVAAGMSADPARVPLASVLRFGWSFGDESLIEGIETVGSEQLVVIAPDGTVVRRSHPAHEQAAARRAAGVDVDAVRETIVGALADYVRVNRRIGTPLEVELSAGFDSRAVISLAHHAAREDVRAFTDGPPASQDARVARKVAAALRIAHRAGGTNHNTRASRLAYVHELALATSGQGTALVAMTSSDRSLAEAPDSLGGDGGEVFRGYYYPRFGRGERAKFDVAKLTDFVLGKFTVGARLLDLAQEAAVRSAVEARLRRFAPHCDLMADGYDLLYLIERTGTWNQKLRRLTAADRRRNPFYSRAATYAFLALPGARARIARIHETVMRRLAPEALWIPLNGETIPALAAGGPVARAASRTITLAAKVMWKVRDKLGRAGRAGTGQGDLEDVRIRKLIDHIDGDWGSLLGPESVTRALIGDEAMNGLVAAARSGQRWGCEVVANVVIAETFFAAAKRVAARHAPNEIAAGVPRSSSEAADV
jgi:hypothetical protein